MKSSIRKKVQTLFELDIPLLVKNNFIAFDDKDKQALARALSTRPTNLERNKSYQVDESLGKVEVVGSNPTRSIFSCYGTTALNQAHSRKLSNKTCHYRNFLAVFLTPLMMVKR
jgi:hypothetical protein